MDYWTLKKKAIIGSMQSGKVSEVEGYPLKLENAIKGNMKDYKIWGNKKGKNYLDISKIDATPDSTASLFISEVDTSTGSIIIFSTDNYVGGGYCNTGKKLEIVAPHLEVGKTYFLNGTTQSSVKRIYLATSKYIWNFGAAHTITEEDLQSILVLYGLSTQHSNGTGICKIEGLSITEEASTEYEPYQENDGLGAFGNIDVVNSGKNMLKATDVYKGASNYSELVEDGRNCIRFVDNSVRKYYYPFKENTRYTISFDCKITTRSTENTNASLILRVAYTDGIQSNIVLYDSQKDTWIHKTLKTLANRTISWIGLQAYSYVHWCYIDIDTFQFEEGTTETPYEPFREPTTTTIDLTGHNSIMPNEYIDFKNQVIVRSDGTEEDIVLPKIPLHKGYNIITASDAEIEATKMYGKYLKKG